MSVEIEPTTYGPWPALQLSNRRLSLMVVPALGGKITSLRSLLSGKEWLWTNPHLRQRDPKDQTDYVGQFDTGGWDEVFPTIDACLVNNSAWGGRPLSDHGELWQRPADVTSTTIDGSAASICLRINGEPLPFSFERTLSLAADEALLEIAYRLTNHSERSLPYIWAAHPILQIEPGMRISLPDSVEVHCAGGIGIDLQGPGKPFCWPVARNQEGQPLDLSRVPEPTGVALKLFTQPLQAGWVAITSTDRRETVRFDVHNSQQIRVGMWLNYGGWSGSGSMPYFNAGIEPTTSPCDSLSDAITEDLAAVVPPGDAQQWTLMTTLIRHAGD